MGSRECDFAVGVSNAATQWTGGWVALRASGRSEKGADVVNRIGAKKKVG